MTPELRRPFAIERLGRAGLDVTVEADATECAALARRMDLPAVQSLTCRFRLEQDASGDQRDPPGARGGGMCLPVGEGAPHRGQQHTDAVTDGRRDAGDKSLDDPGAGQ